MKRILMFLITLVFFSWIAGFGCGGGTGSMTDETSADPSISLPDDITGDGSDTSGAIDDAQDLIVPASPDAPQFVLIKGALVGPEGTGIPNARLEFHSDPVSVVTDTFGMFEALLEVGSHTVEVVSEEFGTFTGSITVAASGLVNSAGRALGSFATTVFNQVVADACRQLNLKDLGESVMIDTYAGVAQSALGEEIYVQGVNQTSLIVGNSEMLANISIDGRLSGLWFPTVGAFNHIPYLSKVDSWVKPFQGSFGGIKRGEDYYWFTDRNYWSFPAITYQSGTFAPIAEMTYTGLGVCAGATVKEKVYVAYNSYLDGSDRANVLIRDFTITGPTIINLCRTTENASASPELALYARFNTNDTYQLFKQWMPADNTRDCRDNRMYWFQEDNAILAPIANIIAKNDPDLHSYTIAMSAHDYRGSRLTMQDCTESIETAIDASRVVSSSLCVPTGVKGSIVEWTIPLNRRIVVATAGCDLDGGPCDTALNAVARTTADALENTVKTQWTTWLGTPAVRTDWRNRVKRWLVTMKLLADRNTGALIAAPSQEPAYYGSWPRDGIFQSLAYMMAGKYDVAEKFFRYLFGIFEDVEDNDGWDQAYSSHPHIMELGLPDFIPRLNIEEDQAPTVLWGLWVYWTKRGGSLPDGISTEMIENVANYVVDQMCPNGLIRPSIDRLESPLLHLGQSLYTNAAAYAGLAAAAKMIESSNPAKADDYRNAALSIRAAVENDLCDSTTCHTRIWYPLTDLLSDGNNKTMACAKCELYRSLNIYVGEDFETMMAFAWPFHILELGDVRVRDYYNTVWTTHQELSNFSYDEPLWVPRYLFSYLFAKAAHADSGVSSDFKGRLLEDIREVEGNIDAVTTDYGYLMELYIDGEEDNPEAFGPDYAGKKIGLAARPLGWAQAMGVLMGYAMNTPPSFVPLIDPPAAPTGCIPGSGPCCDSDGTFKLSSYICNTSTEYGCPDGTACGADVKSRTVNQYCSGSSSSCTGSIVRGSWSVTPVDDCTSSEMCVAGNPVCQPCGSSCECASGPCCDGCHLYPPTHPCGTETRLICEWGTDCGADVSQSFRTRYCSGTSNLCNGAYDPWIAPVPADYCDATEVCVPGNPTCQPSSACSTCECTPGSGPCCDGCNYYPSSRHCETVTERGCPWGTACNDDVGTRTGNRHCTGTSSSCNGTVGDWTTWTVWGTPCNNRQACSTTTFTCETPSRCACDPILTWPASFNATGVVSGVMLEWNLASGASTYIITRSFGSLSGCPPLTQEIRREDYTPIVDATIPSGSTATYGVYAVDACGNISGCGGFDVATRL